MDLVNILGLYVRKVGSTVLGALKVPLSFVILKAQSSDKESFHPNCLQKWSNPFTLYDVPLLTDDVSSVITKQKRLKLISDLGQSAFPLSATCWAGQV